MITNDSNIMALKKLILNNDDIKKLLMHYRIIKKQNDSDTFKQDHNEYNNKYEFNDSIDIKEKYLDKTLSNDDIKNNQNKISDTSNIYNDLINNALSEILEYLCSNHIDESEINNIIDNYNNNQLYISLDSRYLVDDIIHCINESLLFSEKDKTKIEETIL